MPRARSRLARRGAAGTVTGEGVVLTRAGADKVAAWARRGLGPVVVVPVRGWTLVCPGGRPKARYPYDDAVRTLAGRPVSHAMRPAVGFFRVGKQAVVTVHPRRRWAATRWLIWTPWDGIVTPKGLAVATPLDVARGLGKNTPETLALVEEILADTGAVAKDVLAALLGVFEVPGVDVLAGVNAADLPGAVLVVPPDRYARAFDRVLQTRAQDETDENEEDGPA